MNVIFDTSISNKNTTPLQPSEATISDRNNHTHHTTPYQYHPIWARSVSETNQCQKSFLKNAKSVFYYYPKPSYFPALTVG